MKFARRGLNILYLTQKPIATVPVYAQGAEATAADVVALRNITVQYCKTLPALLKTILELHTWHRQPSLVILESLHTFFLPIATESEAARDKGYTEFTENHALVIASLLNAIDSMFLKSKTPSFSIVTTDFNSSLHYDEFKQLLLDLYYNQANSYFEHGEQLKELKETFDRFLS